MQRFLISCVAGMGLLLGTLPALAYDGHHYYGHHGHHHGYWYDHHHGHHHGWGWYHHGHHGHHDHHGY